LLALATCHQQNADDSRLTGHRMVDWTSERLYGGENPSGSGTV